MSVTTLHTQHPRQFESFRFVYPVLSRRSGAVSLGINLNPDKICNFDCIYCQVDRTRQSEVRFVETDQLIRELEAGLKLVTSGAIFEFPGFAAIPSELRRLNDLAFSGDGEPTTYRNFDEILERCARIKRTLGLTDVKMVLITNASMFHRPHVQRGLRILDANQGEIWAKLEAGTEGYYQRVERTPIPFHQILTNITDAARVRPLVIQALFMKIDGEPPPASEREAFCVRLNEITAAGGKLKIVQIYTVARRPAESFVTPLSDDQIDDFVELVQRETGLEARGYYGMSTETEGHQRPLTSVRGEVTQTT